MCTDTRPEMRPETASGTKKRGKVRERGRKMGIVCGPAGKWARKGFVHSFFEEQHGHPKCTFMYGLWVEGTAAENFVF